MVKRLVPAQVRSCAAFYCQHALPRAARDWGKFLRRHFLAETGIAALVLLVAWQTGKDTVVESLGDSFVALVKAVFLFAAGLAVWEIIQAPVRVNSDLQKKFADREQEFISTLGHLQQIQRKYGSNVFPLTRPALDVAARLLITELKDIRHKIELFGKDPAIPPGFKFPSEQWTQYREFIAEDPALHETVETAYTKARHVDDVFAWRRTVATSRLIGVNAEDGLAELDTAALAAIDALAGSLGPAGLGLPAPPPDLIRQDLVKEVRAAKAALVKLEDAQVSAHLRTWHEDYGDVFQRACVEMYGLHRAKIHGDPRDLIRDNAFKADGQSEAIANTGRKRIITVIDKLLYELGFVS